MQDLDQYSNAENEQADYSQEHPDRIEQIWLGS